MVFPALATAHGSRAREIHYRPIDQHEAVGRVARVGVAIAALTGSTHAPAHRLAVSSQCHGRGTITAAVHAQLGDLGQEITADGGPLRAVAAAASEVVAVVAGVAHSAVLHQGQRAAIASRDSIGIRHAVEDFVGEQRMAGEDGAGVPRAPDAGSLPFVVAPTVKRTVLQNDAIAAVVLAARHPMGIGLGAEHLLDPLLAPPGHPEPVRVLVAAKAAGIGLPGNPEFAGGVDQVTGGIGTA